MRRLVFLFLALLLVSCSMERPAPLVDDGRGGDIGGGDGGGGHYQGYKK